MRLIPLLLLPFLLSSCVAAAFTTVAEGGKAIADERTLGRQVDDATIYTAINRRFLDADVNDIMVNVTVNVRHARVMLTGNVDAQASVQKAAELAWQVEGVQEVINEITVVRDGSFWNNASDALIKKNLEGRLFIIKDVSVVSYSLDVVSGTAYLLGAVKDEAEMQRVLNVTRTTRGIKRVVNYLKLEGDLLQSRNAPMAAPAPEPVDARPLSYEDKYRSMQRK